MNTQHANFISNYTTAVNSLLDARAALKSLREQYTALGLGSGNTLLTTDDFAGSNAYLSPAAITSALATMDALEAILTNFSATPPTPTAALQALLAFRP
ncbi:MAG: hypothetical protein P4L84_35025 [Isosphaeraceae bacterium]|nr:hypothetical protein [Isosphaeraceae bacterium]